MSVHLPALPSSLDTTMAVLGMFAFVLASGGTHVAVDARASRAAKDVLTKAKRLMEECQACVELQKKAVEQIQNLEAPKTPLAAATTAEEISEMVATFGRAVAKITQAATLMEQALDAADKHGPVLERRKKGWRKAGGDIRPTAS